MTVTPEFTARDQRTPLRPTKSKSWTFLSDLRVGGGRDFQSVQQINGKINLKQYDWGRALLEMGDLQCVDTVDVLGAHLLTRSYSGPKIDIFKDTYTPYKT